MRFNYLKATLTIATFVALALLLGAAGAMAQTVNLTAASTTALLPDGQSVPMWGYTCGTVNANCKPLNPNAGTGWSPVLITIPTGGTLTINLTNNLPGITINTPPTTGIPTSLMIVGQLGGGLGGTPTRTASPAHPTQVATWPIAGSGAFQPPPQTGRVQSFGTEVAWNTTTALCWGPTCTNPTPALQPGTYLLESGTHPSIQVPMGLYGVLVVTDTTTTPATAYTVPGAAKAVTYDSDVVLLLSEIDPVQNAAVALAVTKPLFTETTVWSGQPGGCGNKASANYQACYPPAVNYDPRYYLVNGATLDSTKPSGSVTASSGAPTAGTGQVLLRFVNAGSRMHVPSVVGALTGTPAVSGVSLIAEDGNLQPDVALAISKGITPQPKVQSEVFLAAGKTFDVMINAPAAGSKALPVFDRALSLSTNNQRNGGGGMAAFISINGSGLPSTLTSPTASATGETYYCVAGVTLTVSDPAKGVLANDVGANGAALGTVTLPATDALSFNGDGTFVYTQPSANTSCGGSFTYFVNGTVMATATITECDANNHASCPYYTAAPTANADTYTSNIASRLEIAPPGVLLNDKDPGNHPLTARIVGAATGGTVTLNPDGSFIAIPSTPPIGAATATVTFTYNAVNSQLTPSANSATVTVTFNGGSGLKVNVQDFPTKIALTDYRWIIEEDRTFYVDPTKTTNTGGIVPTFGVNFHTSFMPVIATGCVANSTAVACESSQTMLDTNPASPTFGTHINVVCDIGNGICRPGSNQAPVSPGDVHLDPARRYYISVLPGDAANSFVNGGGAIQPVDPNNPNGPQRPFDMAKDCGTYTGPTGNWTPGTGQCGHGMGGAPISPAQIASPSLNPVNVLVEPNPYQTARLSVFVFEDDFPLNGEQDAGGGIDVLASNEPGLGHFNITLFDDAGGTGDATGQMTYDMFNMPLSNSLAGQIDPITGQDACPISRNPLVGADGTIGQLGITGTIVTCPKFEADGITLSPLAGQAVIANLMPGRYGVVAVPGADRIQAGEQWLQTNTLDGQKAHDSFLRIGEPGYFQEYGPAGYHVSIGFANPAIINARLPGICNGTDPNLAGVNCTNTVTGNITTERMSRTPDERLYSSGSYDSFSFTQCYVSIGDPDGEDFAFTKCDANGKFTLSGLPDGQWRITVFDQWNDMLVDGLSTPVALSGGGTTNMGEIAMNQWQSNIYTQTFLDLNGNGVRDSNEPGLPLVATNNRFRDGSFSNFNNTDLDGNAGFNEIFPLFSWYVIETDYTRFKNTGTHVVYDAGGPADGSASCGVAGYPPCGTSTIGQNMANTYEQNPLPPALHVPGAVYCNNADCTGQSIKNGPTSNQPNSTGRIDPPWVLAEGWQGFSGQNNFIEFGKTPYAAATATTPAENGGIRGHVVYASTRPFDDPQLLLQTSWEPLVPHVTINLYQEGTAADGTQTLKLVDTTQTSSWDDWAQGFRSDGQPNMNCPGQSTADLFYFTLFNQPSYLNLYNTTYNVTDNPMIPNTLKSLPNNSQFKCYDGMHNWNQVQPAPYDGMYLFPSVTSMDPVTGKPTGTNCTACVTNPDATDPYRFGTPMLPAGKYVVEVVVPPGYELVKEEDKNILIGDNFIAPVAQQFGGLSNIFILPDQAAVGAAYNANSAQNMTQALGRSTFPSDEGDTGSVETYWPCVGALRVVPDYISLFPQSKEVAPFAGAVRNLCDRKEVVLEDQMQVLAKFYIFTSTHAAAHFTGIITDDFTSEFDPFSPQFGEKFSPPNLPVSLRDFNGNEIARTYSDWWGAYDGLNYSTWEVNPPNPTGYAPTMMVVCMNDKGPIVDTRAGSPTLGQLITDPLFNPSYSQFCYELPFMPGQTQYMDTPVVPTSGFAGAGYNNPDCAYADATPAISEVDGDGIGPWVSGVGSKLTITALGPQAVYNNGYSGPSAKTAPFDQKTVTRNYVFGTTPGTVALVGSDGVSHPLGNVSWGNLVITGTVPSGLPPCPGPKQQGQSQALCGELVITAANGKTSVDTVTVTIGGKAPTHVAAAGSIQTAIDQASPGDLIIVDPTCMAGGVQVACTTTGAIHVPSTHKEMLLMWKPIRLQGVGAASSIIDASTQPAGKMDPWRAQVSCLFGLARDGQPYTSTGNTGGANPFDLTGQYTCGSTNGTSWTGFTAVPNVPQVDRLPLEGILGWDTTVNGNLAELLQEPSLMGAYEGAGITVLSKGVLVPPGTDIFGNGAEAGFPAGSRLLTDGNTVSPLDNQKHPEDCSYPSNFLCNPSSIDGLTITDSSQGGGGIFVHAWGHNIQIANNQIYGNAGTLSGGINIGQGEFPEAYLQPDTSSPTSCLTPAQLALIPTNTQLPYCFNLNVNMHHNSITLNSSIGDELFSATPAGAGAASIATGSDNYKFTNNWVCGNLSSGDGGGFGHLGFSYNGDIEHNTFLFNQSTNPTIPTNGGAIIIMGAPPDGQTLVNGVLTECGSVTDNDCVPGLGDGAGPGLKINANLIMGNGAESGSGGGIRFQAVNGTDIARFPDPTKDPNNNNTTIGDCTSQYKGDGTFNCLWYLASVTNNIITNNVAGWDGGGVSLEDSLVVNFINNTVISNDSTASAGVLFNTLGAPLASSQTPGKNQTKSPTSSAPQAGGLVTMLNSPQLTSSFVGVGTIVCPPGHANCTRISNPILYNDIFWQNRSFQIGVGALSPQYQQNIVTLYNSSFVNGQSTGSLAASQTFTGQCPAGSSYWDIGVRGDTGPNDHSGLTGFSLAPTYSILTSVTGYNSGGAHNSTGNPAVASQYCNGSRVPPEFQKGGYNVPPGISDATVPNPIFSLQPTATVDEGNNWINISWGPLALTNPVTNVVLGSYVPTTASSTIDQVPTGSPTYAIAPKTDFFGNTRPDPGNPAIDIGAVEFGAGSAAAVPTLTSIVPNSGARGAIVSVTLTGTHLTGATSVTVSQTGVSVSGITVVNDTTVTATFTISTTAAISARNVSITTLSGTSNTVTFNVVAQPAPTLTSISPTSITRPATGSSAVPVTLTGTNLAGATVTVSGGGITVGAITVSAGGTTISTTFTVSSSASISGPNGTRTVTVTTPGGTATITFTLH